MGKRLHSKITCVFEIEGEASPEQVGAEAERRMRAIKIKTAMLQRGHTAAMYARELGVVRHYITNVINGVQKTPRIRKYIEKRLGMKFWS